MATAIRRRRGTTDQHQTFVGLLGEITVDTDKDTIVIHDSVTTGGFPIAREDLSNVSSASITGAINLNDLSRTKLALGAPNDVIINSATGELSSEPQLAITRGGTGANNITDARNNLGLGSLALQNDSNVSITGGSITGITDLAVADGGTGASTAAAARNNLVVVHRAGDTMTGDLTVGDGTGTFQMNIDGAAGNRRFFAYRSGGLRRWETGANETPETGGNSGSDYLISRFDDAGVFVDVPISISRQTGSVSFNTDVLFNNSVALSSPLPVSQGGTGATTATLARDNLGLGTIATQDASSVAITGGSIINIVDLAIADGGTGASTAADARDNLVVVHRAGDTMTGDLTVGDGSSSSAITVDGAGGSTRNVNFATGGLFRWSLLVDSSSELGSNSGSDFILTRNDDLGAFINAPLTISRGDGSIVLEGETTILGNMSLSNPLSITSGGTGANSALGARTNLNLLDKAGDTMFGNFTVGDGLGSKTLSINGAAGFFRNLSFNSTGFTRWTVVVDDIAEGPATGVSLDKVTNPATLPTGTGFGVDFLPVDGNQLAVAHSSSPHVTIYEESGGVFTKLANPDIVPPGSGLGLAYSADGVHLAVTHLTLPRLTIYERNGTTYTKIPNPSFLPPDVAWAPAFSLDGKFLAVAHTTSPFVTIYERIGNTFTKLPDPATIPAGGANSVAFSADSRHMAVAHGVLPFVTIYRIDGTTFTKVANPSVLPTGDGDGVSFSFDGKHMAVAHANSPFVTVYEQFDDTFVKIADPDVLPTGDSESVDFSTDGRILSVAHVNSPFVTHYIRDGNILTKIADSSILPAGTGNGVGYSADSKFAAVAHVNSPFVSIYSVNEVTPDIGSDFRIRRHNDVGDVVDSSIFIERSSGDISIAGNATFAQNITAVGTATLGSPLVVTSGGTGASSPSGARTNLGLGSIAVQDASNVAITGGSITGITPLAVVDGGTGAATPAGARTNLGAVNIAGDTMTGDLIVGDGTLGSSITVDGAVGFTRAFNLQTSGLNRWSISAGSGPETGSNVGSNFILTRNDDSGAFINAPITITRSNGNMVLDANVTITGPLTINGVLNLDVDLPITSGGTGANNAVDAATNLNVVKRSGDTMTGNLQVPGFRFTQGLRAARREVTNNYTTTSQDFIIGVSDLSVSRDITLVSASNIGTGGIQIIKDESGLSGGTNSITIQTTGSESIDGESSVTITAPYGVVRLYSDGLNWFSI